MGKVKSVRIDNGTEAMLSVLWDYYSKNKEINDSEIIKNGIEIQYKNVSENMNKAFRDKVKIQFCEDNLKQNILDQILDMIEVLSLSKGKLLQNKFSLFLKVNAKNVEMSDLSADEELIRKQYKKVYETAVKYCDKSVIDYILKEVKENLIS